MKPLSPVSPRRVAAAAFGAELRKAMKARGVSVKRLQEAIGGGTSSVAIWKLGDNLPRTDTARRVAEALDWPKLVEIVREARSGSCGRCGRTFVNEGGALKLYCSSDCRDIAATLRSRPTTGALYDTVKAELERVHGTTLPVSRRTLSRAVERYRLSESKRQVRSRGVESRLAVVQSAVDAMCRDCEPLGVCREAACPLRAVSPLPLALDDRPAAEVRPALGPHHPSNRQAWLTSVQAGNAARWGRPGEREAASATMLARYAAETPAQKAERARRVSEGRRRAS